MELPGGEQGGVLLTRHGRRQEAAMLAWPKGPWEAATTNPGLEEGMHPISDGDRVGAGSPDEDFLPYVSALGQQWRGFRNGVREKTEVEVA